MARKVKRELLQRYTDPRACCYVLSCLLKNPRLLRDKNRYMDETFFINKTHKALFLVIENLSYNGLDRITLGDIETYLATHDELTYKRFFVVGDESEWILELLDLDTDENNYDYYYNIIKKFAYLRAKMETGQDVTDVLDMSEIDNALVEQQYEIFINTPLNEIIHYFDSLNLDVKSRFTTRGTEQSKKAGDGSKKIYEQLSQSPDYGFRLSTGKYMDSLARGARKGMLVIDSRESGTGKTRDSLMQCVMLSCNEYWSHENNCFIPNPYGMTVPSLYFGTELKLDREVEPILWSCISGVESGKIKKDKLTPKERERVEYAIEILEKSDIYLEREPDYDCMFLENMIERYVTKFGVQAVMIDYIELTPPMIGEYVHLTRGLQAREDSVLLHVSTVLKNLTEQYNIFIKFYTQISDNARRDYTVRDSGAIKGSKSLQARTDLALVTMRPTEKELKLVKPFIEEFGEPDIIFNCYKNRDGEIPMFKVFAKLDLGTFEFEELFITDWMYRPFKYKTIKPIDLHVELEEVEVDKQTGEVIEKPRKSRRG